MKIFKRIYFSVISILFVLMFTLSFVNATVGNKSNKLGEEFVAGVRSHLDNIASTSHNSVYATGHSNAIEYISKQLNSAAGLTLGTSYEEDDSTVYEYATLSNKPIGTYVLQRETVSEDTLKAIDADRKQDSFAVWEVDKQVTNIVVYIPGETSLNNFEANNAASGDVVMMMAHYDSRIEGAGASDNGTQVSAMLENIIYITKNSLSFKNDLLFVFTDAEEEGLYGAYTFKHQFKGFDDIYNRVKLGTNFDALGNKGSLVMFESSKDNYELISSYSKINGNTFTSSIADFVYGGMANYTDFNIYHDIPSLNFATLGGSNVYHSARDTVENTSDSTIIQQANMMNSLIKTFGSYNLNSLESSKNAVYFSYLDIFTVVYSYIFSYLLAAIIICLLVAVILVNQKKKIFSLTKTGLGAVAQLLVILGSVLALFALYYLFSLLISAMGIIPFRAIGKLTVESIGLVVSFMLLATVISAFLSIPIRKIFDIKSADIIRGNILIWVVLAIVLAIFVPNLSYFFAITAILELVVLLLATIFSEKFKNKFNAPIGTLFPYVLPLLFTIPMIVPVIMIASMVLKSMFIPIIMILFMLMSGFITPYIVLATKYAEKLFSKLPQTYRKVQKEVTETVEDNAKKGRFVEKTSIKVVKEKYDIKYRHAYGLTLFVVIFSIIAIVFSGLGFNLGKNFTTYGSYRNAVNNSSMVLVWEQNNSDTATTSIELKDFMAFKYINAAEGGYSWSFDKKAYVKSIYDVGTIIGGSPTISTTGKEYTFSIYNSERSLVTLKLTDTEKLTKLTIKSAEGVTHEYENSDRAETMQINLPYKFGSFVMTVEGVDFINLEYTETIMDIGSSIANLADLDEWKNVLEHYSGNSEVTDYLNSGIVFRIIKNKF